MIATGWRVALIPVGLRLNVLRQMMSLMVGLMTFCCRALIYPRLFLNLLLPPAYRVVMQMTLHPLWTRLTPFFYQGALDDSGSCQNDGFCDVMDICVPFFVFSVMFYPVGFPGGFLPRCLMGFCFKEGSARNVIG